MNLRWSYKAQKQQDAAADYIYQEFGEGALRKFHLKIDEIESKLVEFPEMGKKEPLLKHRTILYRSIVITKKNKLIYSVKKDCIFIHALWDTRREPKKQSQEV